MIQVAYTHARTNTQTYPHLEEMQKCYTASQQIWVGHRHVTGVKSAKLYAIIARAHVVMQNLSFVGQCILAKRVQKDQTVASSVCLTLLKKNLKYEEIKTAHVSMSLLQEIPPWCILCHGGMWMQLCHCYNISCGLNISFVGFSQP